MILSTYGSIRIDRFVEPYPPSMKENWLINGTTESSFENEMILNNIIKLYGAATGGPDVVCVNILINIRSV